MRPDLACRGDFGGPLLEVVTVIERLASDCGDEVLSGSDGPDMSMSHGLGFWRDDATNTVPRLVNDAGVRFDFDDTAAVLLHFRKGALGTILISESTPSPWSWEGSVSERLGFHNAGRDYASFVGTDAALGFPGMLLWSYDPGDREPGWMSPLTSRRVEVEPNRPVRRPARALRSGDPGVWSNPS